MQRVLALDPHHGAAARSRAGCGVWGGILTHGVQRVITVPGGDWVPPGDAPKWLQTPHRPCCSCVGACKGKATAVQSSFVVPVLAQALGAGPSKAAL